MRMDGSGYMLIKSVCAQIVWNAIAMLHCKMQEK